MVEKNNVLAYLREEMADPFSKDVAYFLLKRIEDDTPIGKLIMRMLNAAEKGRFT